MLLACASGASSAAAALHCRCRLVNEGARPARARSYLWSRTQRAHVLSFRGADSELWTRVDEHHCRILVWVGAGLAVLLICVIASSNQCRPLGLALSRSADSPTCASEIPPSRGSK